MTDDALGGQTQMIDDPPRDDRRGGKCIFYSYLNFRCGTAVISPTHTAKVPGPDPGYGVN